MEEAAAPLSGPSLPAKPARRPGPAVPNAVVGMLMFIGTELMFFAGLISAFVIVRAQAEGGVWPPLGQPRLPLEETAINTGALLLSGWCLFMAGRVFRVDPARAKTPYLAAVGLGCFFVLFQGLEWVGLLREGLTLTSSTHGSFFYLIVGSHALHVLAALIALAYCFRLLTQGRLRADAFWAMRLFWYFVVGVWPILYFRVYVW